MIVSTNDGGGKGSKACFVLNQRNEGNRFGMEATAADWTRAAAALAHFFDTHHPSPTFRPRGARFSLHTTLLDCVGRGQGGSGQGFVRLDEQRARSARCCSGTLDLEPEPA